MRLPRSKCDSKNNEASTPVRGATHGILKPFSPHVQLQTSTLFDRTWGRGPFEWPGSNLHSHFAADLKRINANQLPAVAWNIIQSI